LKEKHKTDPQAQMCLRDFFILISYFFDCFVFFAIRY